MMKGMRSNADGVLEAKRRSQKWKRLAGVLGCLVVFVTAYVLMRPAETLERELICGMEEHQHSVELGCYQEAAAESVQPICGLEETGHAHSEDCYSEESVLTCTEPEGDAHQHDENCYTAERVLTCGLEEAEGHTHTAECYPAGDVEAEPELTLVCELPEHTHTEDCYADDAAQHAQVEEVAALIDALPSAEEVEARLTELLAAEDTEAYDAYCAELARQVEQANAAYEALSDEQKAQLNIDRLTALFVYLPAKEQLFTLTAPATESGIVVTISGEASSLPFPAEELTLTAAEVEDENANALRDEALESAALTAAENYMLDIRLMHGDEEVQPTGPITVTFAGLPLDEGADAALVDDIDDSGDDDAALVNDVDDSGDADAAAYQAQEMAAQAVMADAADEMDILDKAAGDTEVDADESSVTGPKVYQIDEETRQATEVDVAVNEENNVVLETNQLTDLYSVSVLAIATQATNVVNNYKSLKSKCETGSVDPDTGTVNVQLGADITPARGDPYPITIPSGKTVSVDLNGYEISIHHWGADSGLFKVPKGALLVIWDSSAKSGGISKKEKTSTEKSVTCGKLTSSESAGYNAWNTLYYVTTSQEAKSSANHLTTETQVKHKVALGGENAGAITGGGVQNQYAILSTGGTVTLKGGYIYNFGHKSKGDASNSAITLQGGTFNLEGGAIIGNRNPAAGGAIRATGGATVNMTGGIISGNQAVKQGGAVYCLRSTFIMSGGYITNNITTSDIGLKYDQVVCGGGGIFLDKGASFTMSNGYITSNLSTMRGGGISTFYLEDDNLTEGPKARITINGGFIAANTAKGHEGGGINCDSGNHCVIKSTGKPIYISHNRMENPVHWGGGGVYIGHSADLNIYSTLITKNSADGIGGGYASCHTSDTFFYLGNGVGIFDNTVKGGDRGKGADRNLHYFGTYSIADAGNPPDIFTGGKTKLYAEMLGGGDPLWAGSRDGTKFSMKTADVLCTADKVMGLKASPSDAAKSAARTAAKVYITGNYSATHGAGIMSNGIVYFGEDTYTGKHTPTRLDLVGTKELLQKDGVTSTTVPAETFQFTMSDEEGNVISTATADSTGAITFSRLLFSAAGTYKYVIKETSSPSATIRYDTTSYTLTVTVAAEKEVINYFGTATGVYYFPTAATVVNNDTGATVFTSNNVHEDSTVILRSTSSGGAAFTNQLKDEEYSVKVTKVDSGDPNHTLAGAEFKLEVKNGDAYTPVSGVVSGVASGTAGMYTYAAAGTSGAVTTFVTAENGNLQIVGLPAGDYKLTETKAPEGYLIAAEWQTGREFTLSKEAAPTGAYTVTVADPSATYTFQFLKVSAADKTTPVPGATYQLLDSKGEAVTFTQEGTNYRYNASGTITDLVTGTDGRFQLTGLPQGSYTLRETAVPAGFGFAPDHAFTLSPETTENQVFTYTQEEPVAYELPETGGRGAKPYVITGAALLVGAACLMVCREARRKAGGRTS